MSTPIYFYGKTDEFYEFSNFSPHGFETDEGYWPTVEHYFQAQKFSGDENLEYRERVRCARRPKDAKDLGQSRKIPLRANWNEVKEDVMIFGLRKKFERQELLLSTGERPLVEKSDSDHYWGCGASGSGLNRMGALLEAVRSELRARDV